MRAAARLRRSVRLEVVLPAVILFLGLAATASLADTIYLKNGRVIHTSTVRVEGDKVEFLQYGGWVVVPRSIVDRVEQNERGSPEASPARQPAADETTDTGDETGGEEQEGQEGAGSGQEAQQAGEGEGEEGEEEDQPPPEETRAYWRELLRPLFSQMDRIEAELERFRPLASTSPAAAVRVERLESEVAEFQEQVDAIRQRARRLGVPPGWVRR